MPKPLLFILSTTALPEKIATVGVAGMATGNPVGANGMPPGDGVSPRCSEWVVLEEQMMLTLIIHEPIGIVHPVNCGREMELRPIRFLIGRDALSKGTLAESQEQYNGCRSQNIDPLRQRLSPLLRGERTDLLFHVVGVLSGEARGLLRLSFVIKFAIIGLSAEQCSFGEARSYRPFMRSF